MYLTRNETMVQPGSTADYEEFFKKIGEFRKGKPGVLGQTLLRSYAYPGKYVLISRWESVEAAWDLQKTEGYREVLKSAPGGGGGGGGRPQEGYDDVFNVDSDDLSAATVANYACEILIDWQLQSSRVGAAFEKNRKEHFELNKKQQKGFGSNRLRRSAGDGTKYLGIGLYKDRESFIDAGLKALAATSAREFLAAPAHAEVFAVIHRI